MLDPVARDGDSVAGGTNRAAGALEDFASTVRSIRRRWEILTEDAQTFRARIAEEGEDWDDGTGFLWLSENPNVAENRALYERGLALSADYEEAERDCANQINAGLDNRTRFEAMPSDGELDEEVFYHGYADDLADVATEWESDPAETDLPWWGDAGVATWDFGVGAVEGLGGMLGAHSSEGWFNASWGDAMFEYHEDNLQSALGLVGMYDAESDSYGWAGLDTVGESWKDLAHSVVPWEEWGERPGYVIGTALLNIGATVGGIALSATGVGAVVGAPLLAWRGAAILDGMGGRGGSGDSGAGLDVDLPNGQRYGGPGAPVVQIDANTFDPGDFTPDQLTGMRDSLNRVQNLEPGGGSGSRPTGPSDGTETTRPTRPTTRPTADEDASPPDTSRLNRNEDEADLEPTETSNRWGTDAEESGANTTTDTHSTTREGNDSEAGGTPERSSTGENGREPTTEQLSESDRLLNQVEQMFSSEDHTRFRANENTEVALHDGNRALTDPGSSNLTEVQVAERYGLHGEANSTFSDMRATASDYPHVPWEGGPGQARPNPGADLAGSPALVGGPDNTNTFNAQASPPNTSGTQYINLTGTGGSPGSFSTLGTSSDLSGNRHNASMQDNNSPIRNSTEDGNGNSGNSSENTRSSPTTGPTAGSTESSGGGVIPS